MVGRQELKPRDSKHHGVRPKARTDRKPALGQLYGSDGWRGGDRFKGMKSRKRGCVDSCRVLVWITEVGNQSGESSSERVWKAGGGWPSRRAEGIEFEVPSRTGKGGGLVEASRSNGLTLGSI